MVCREIRLEAVYLQRFACGLIVRGSNVEEFFRIVAGPDGSEVKAAFVGGQMMSDPGVIENSDHVFDRPLVLGAEDFD